MDFPFNIIYPGNISTWPNSPDREKDGRGRQAYHRFCGKLADYNHRPAGTLRFTDLKTEIENSSKPLTQSDCKGDYIGSAHVYVSDPVLFILEKCIASNRVYVDDTVDETFLGKGRIMDCDLAKGRCPVLYQKSPCLTDFSQNTSVGNCGLVAAIGMVVEHPHSHNMLFSSIYPPVYNPYGVYSVRLLFGKGENKTIIGYVLIDDRTLKRPAGLSSVSMWYLFIEKAFYSINDYKINGKGGGAPFRFGLISEKIYKRKECGDNDYWRALLQVLHNEKFPSRCGFNGHAYTLLDAVEFEYNGKTIRLIKWHNPVNYVPNYKDGYHRESEEWLSLPDYIKFNVLKDHKNYINGHHTDYWVPLEVHVGKRQQNNLVKFVVNPGLPQILKNICHQSAVMQSVA